MSIGVLWFDDDPARTLDEKVQAACARHAQKFGVAANTVYVHPSEVGTGLVTVMTTSGGAQVIANKSTLPHCFFAVREEPGGAVLARVKEDT